MGFKEPAEESLDPENERESEEREEENRHLELIPGVKREGQ